ncbi:MAG: chemotaxis protein CheW [Eubacteriales bacterium]
MSEEVLFASQEEINASIEEVEIVTTKYLIFKTEELLFGVDAATVVEILTNHAITKLPMVPDYVNGIINLRGLIIPIIDIRRRLGKESKDDCSIIVINIYGTQVGVLVDWVDRMVDVPDGTILPVPSHNAQKMTSGMSSLPDGGTMLVLDCDLLIHE